MTCSEILQVAKPILFNTEMVRAILDGRKTETRRVIKVNFREGEEGYKIVRNAYTGKFCYLEVYDEWESEVRRIGVPYKPGDYLYVRETCQKVKFGTGQWHWEYRADMEDGRFFSNGSIAEWRPSIHMPKEAARIFLRVTDVRVERLNDMDYMDAIYEGIEPQLGEDGYPVYNPMIDFIDLWDSIIPPKNRDKYGWAANPWVFVIEFERVEVEQ